MTSQLVIECFASVLSSISVKKGPVPDGKYTKLKSLDKSDFSVTML